MKGMEFKNTSSLVKFWYFVLYNFLVNWNLFAVLWARITCNTISLQSAQIWSIEPWICSSLATFLLPFSEMGKLTGPESHWERGSGIAPFVFRFVDFRRVWRGTGGILRKMLRRMSGGVASTSLINWTVG